MRQPSSANTKRIDPQDWEPHKQRIIELYLNPKNALKDVRERIELETGFSASHAQYYRQLNEVWNIKKNFARPNLNHIERVWLQRDRDGKETRLKRYGVRIPKENLQRRISRRPFKSTYETKQEHFTKINGNDLPDTEAMDFDFEIGTPTASITTPYGTSFSPKKFSWLSIEESPFIVTPQRPMAVSVSLRMPGSPMDIESIYPGDHAMSTLSSVSDPLNISANISIPDIRRSSWLYPEEHEVDAPPNIEIVDCIGSPLEATSPKIPILQDKLVSPTDADTVDTQSQYKEIMPTSLLSRKSPIPCNLPKEPVDTILEVSTPIGVPLSELPDSGSIESSAFNSHTPSDSTSSLFLHQLKLADQIYRTRLIEYQVTFTDTIQLLRLLTPINSQKFRILSAIVTRLLYCNRSMLRDDRYDIEFRILAEYAPLPSQNNFNYPGSSDNLELSRNKILDSNNSTPVGLFIQVPFTAARDCLDWLHNFIADSLVAAKRYSDMKEDSGFQIAMRARSSEFFLEIWLPLKLEYHEFEDFLARWKSSMTTLSPRRDHKDYYKRVGRLMNLWAPSNYKPILTLYDLLEEPYFYQSGTSYRARRMLELYIKYFDSSPDLEYNYFIALQIAFRNNWLGLAKAIMKKRQQPAVNYVVILEGLFSAASAPQANKEAYLSLINMAHQKLLSPLEQCSLAEVLSIFQKTSFGVGLRSGQSIPTDETLLIWRNLFSRHNDNRSIADEAIDISIAEDLTVYSVKREPEMTI